MQIMTSSKRRSIECHVRKNEYTTDKQLFHSGPQTRTRVILMALKDLFRLFTTQMQIPLATSSVSHVHFSKSQHHV